MLWSQYFDTVGPSRGMALGTHTVPSLPWLRLQSLPLPLSCNSSSRPASIKLLCSRMSWWNEVCKALSLSGLGSWLEEHRNMVAQTPGACRARGRSPSYLGWRSQGKAGQLGRSHSPIALGALGDLEGDGGWLGHPARPSGLHGPCRGEQTSATGPSPRLPRLPSAAGRSRSRGVRGRGQPGARSPRG